MPARPTPPVIAGNGPTIAGSPWLTDPDPSDLDDAQTKQQR